MDEFTEIEVHGRQGFQVHEEEIQEEPSFFDVAQGLLGESGDSEDAQIFLYRIKNGKQGLLKKVSWDDIDSLEVDQVGREFGPGEYAWLIQYREKGAKRGSKIHQKRVTKTILGDFYAMAHKEYKEEEKRNYGTPPAAPQVDTLSLLERLAPILKGNGGGGDSMVPVLVAMMENSSKMMMESSRAAAESNRTMMLEMSKMQMQMMAFIQGANNQKESTEDAFDRAMDKVIKLADVRQALNPAPPAPESMTDKIFKLVSENLWVLEGLVKMTPQQRQTNSMYQTIVESPDFQAVSDSKQMQLDLIAKLAQTENGEEQIQKLLEIAGWEDPRQS